MAYSLAFILGAPRSGTTLLERMIASHSLVQGGPEPHLLTPLAYLGYWRRVEKAGYDHIVSAIGQRQFVNRLPGGARTYWKACRAYCDTLYGAAMSGSTAAICLDKTPEYVTVWPFLVEVFPDARYVVITRHPGAILSSFVHSFFNGDYLAAYRHDRVLDRYIPAIAGFLRQRAVPYVHVRYEDLVRDPVPIMRSVFGFMSLPFEAQTIEYQQEDSRASARSGLGDPLGVGKWTRPTALNADRWTADFVADGIPRRLLRDITLRLDPADLSAIGYPLDEFWSPIDGIAGGETGARQSQPWNWYRLNRWLIAQGRSLARRHPRVRRGLQQARLACDVFLREY